MAGPERVPKGAVIKGRTRSEGHWSECVCGMRKTTIGRELDGVLGDAGREAVNAAPMRNEWPESARLRSRLG